MNTKLPDVIANEIKETYKGYVITSPKDSHCALVYKDGQFVTATAGDYHEFKDAVSSIDKAKAKIDKLTS